MHMKPLAEAEVLEINIGEARPRRIFNFFGSVAAGGDGPQAFLVAMGPMTVNRPHFHTADQFQVFFGTPGCTFGRWPIPPVYVHYVDGYTPYGPFTAGPEGLDHFTLRPRAITGSYFMPGSRDKMIRKAGRGLHAEVRISETQRGNASRSTVFEPYPDGLAAFHLSAGPGGSIAAPDPWGSRGQFYVVVNGVAHCQGAALPLKSCLFVRPDEPAPRLSAGPDAGFDVLVLQCPSGSDETDRLPRRA